jgi:hypothetical protein
MIPGPFGEILQVVRAGLDACPDVSEGTREALRDWCAAEEEELRAVAEYDAQEKETRR